MSRRSAVGLAILATTARLTTVTTVLAATPVPSAAAGGDPRSVGQGPGLVGDPLFAVLAVVAIGLAAVGLTLVWVRLTASGRG